MRGFLYILQPNRCNASPICVALYQIVQYMPVKKHLQLQVLFFNEIRLRRVKYGFAM